MLFDSQDIPIQSDKEDYLVFARKYRPQNFQSLIGQKHVIDIFTNAFEKNRVAHAYILTGVRGVGKTTTARILAKGFNCLSSEAPTITPCGTCANCLSIASGNNIDVYEMDAASRTGIDDIREIIDSLPYKPLHCRYKVFIIDEVHMLSKSAFNGLLKTLEEPPGHVKFIFATTEIHKIPATILSRCQKIDLKRVSTTDLKEHFISICQKEQVTYDTVALSQIARAADGSVRDGLSLLDQAVSSGAGHIALESLSDMLGVNLSEMVVDFLALCQENKPQDILEKWTDLHQKGIDPALFIREFLYVIEWFVRLHHNAEAQTDIGFPEETMLLAKKIAHNLSFPKLSRLWDITLKSIEDCKKAPDPSAVCDIMLMRMVYGLHMPDPFASHGNPKETINITEETKKKTLNLS